MDSLFIVQVDAGYPRRTTQWWYGCTSGVEQGEESTTMMMEVDMMDDDDFMEADMSSNEETGVSGQTVSAHASAVLCLLAVTFGRVVSNVL